MFWHDRGGNLEVPTSSWSLIVLGFNRLASLLKLVFLFSFQDLHCGAESRKMGGVAYCVFFQSSCNTRENAREFAPHVDHPARVENQSSQNVMMAEV